MCPEEEGVSDDPTAQICSCNDVTRGSIAAPFRDLGVEGATLRPSRSAAAGTGCGGCEPQVKDILKQELAKLGRFHVQPLCANTLPISRPELMALVRTDPDIYVGRFL